MGLIKCCLGFIFGFELVRVFGGEVGCSVCKVMGEYVFDEIGCDIDLEWVLKAFSTL